MVVLSTPRRLRRPSRVDSMKNPNNELANHTFDNTGGKVLAKGVLIVDGANRTHGRGNVMGDCSVALTSSSVVDGRPDWPSG